MTETFGAITGTPIHSREYDNAGFPVSTVQIKVCDIKKYVNIVYF